jgi:hypothetical protein
MLFFLKTKVMIAIFGDFRRKKSFFLKSKLMIAIFTGKIAFFLEPNLEITIFGDFRLFSMIKSGIFLEAQCF